MQWFSTRIPTIFFTEFTEKLLTGLFGMFRLHPVIINVQEVVEKHWSKKKPVTVKVTVKTGVKMLGF
jgi:hypothetical protein